MVEVKEIEPSALGFGGARRHQPTPTSNVMSRSIRTLIVFLSIFPAQSLSATPHLALGLAPLDRGLSIWYTGQKIWIGAELDRFELSSNKEIIPDPYRSFATPEPPWDAVDHLTRRIRWSVTVQRSLFLDSPTPFVYFRFFFGLTHEEWEHYYHNNWSDFGPELGVGLLWGPFRQASLIIRQGIALEESDKQTPINKGRTHDRLTSTVRLQEARLIALLHF